MKVSSIGLHHGEEPPISGTNGSGTIFFSNCNLRCVFCQNYQISQEGMGRELREQEGMEGILHLQELGCHNINLVSPTHYAAQIAKMLESAKMRGLKIPVVYNTNGSDSVKTLKLFDGLVDIYLPDIKYSSDEMALKYSGVKSYVEKNRAAIAEMFRQVGNLELDENGVGERGLIVRHLVLPDDIAGSYDSLKFLASISKDIQLSIMSQYSPCYKAIGDPVLGRKITREEYDKVLNWAEELGFDNIFAQEMESSSGYFPDFNLCNPFELNG